MKTMNVGRLLVWALLLAMPLWFGSCKKENGSDGPVTPTTIEGSWKISGSKLTGAKGSIDYLEFIKSNVGEDVVACLTDTKITFNSNGKITGTPSPLCKSEGADDYNPAANNASWKVVGSKLIITDSDGPETYDLTVNGNTMTWSAQEQGDLDEDGVNETYTTTVEFKRV